MIAEFIKRYIYTVPVENPLVEDTWQNRRYEAICRKRRCIISAQVGYPGLPQSKCWRCGRKTYHAQESVPTWQLPDHSMHY